MEDFRKYATKHLGMSGTALDSYMNISSSYISPTIIPLAIRPMLPTGGTTPRAIS